MKDRSLDLKLSSYDDLFETEGSRMEQRFQIMELPHSLIDHNPDHPYSVRMDAAMVKLMDSIEDMGILEPCIARPKNGRYELVAGYRRQRAGKEIGIKSLPSIIKEMTDDEATIIMVDSNLHREGILPSEKAKAYKMWLDAHNRQGQRTDLTSAPLEQRLAGRTSRMILAEQSGESEEQIRRYVRLMELIPGLRTMVDNYETKDKGMKKIAMRPAVELSYLSKEEQRKLLDSINVNDCTPSWVQSTKMKELSKEGKLLPRTIDSIMQEEKPNQKEKSNQNQKESPPSTLDERITELIPRAVPKEEQLNFILKALKLYVRHLERKKRGQER